jgi:hypothetical protein
MGLKLSISNISFNADPSEDYFYCNENARIYGRLTLPIDFKSADINSEITAENSGLIAKVFEAAAIIANNENLENGFRIVNNCGADGGQTVGHIHFHIVPRLSGDALQFENTKGDMDALKALADQVRM